MSSVARRYAQTSPTTAANKSRAAEGRAPVILMVSGGADSTALLLLAATSQLDIDDGRGLAQIAPERLHVLHINHQLRGIDAQEDEEFVQELSSRYGIPCTIVRADVAALAAKKGDNVENLGREIRYQAANRLANELSGKAGTPRSAARILTAHTADDRAETFVMNAMRGSGVAGLSSIPRRRNRIVRPLLDKTHNELCDLLRMRGIVWREDKTNEDTHYLRAFVRHEVMPTLKTKNPRVVESLASTCEILSDEDAYLNGIATRCLRDITRRQAPGVLALDAAKLAALDVAIARRVVRAAVLSVSPEARLEARHIHSILRLVAKGSGSHTSSSALDCRLSYGLLFLRASSAKEDVVAGWMEIGTPYKVTPTKELCARLVSVDASQDPIEVARAHAREWENTSVLVDAQAVGVTETGGGLWVDSYVAGDIVFPQGMHGQSKRLSDFLADAHIPAAERSQVPLVRTAPRGEIIWVAALRVDERYKVTSESRLLLELSIREHEMQPNTNSGKG